MFKRVTWFTVGAAVGTVGTVLGYLRAREVARQHLPDSVSDAAARAASLADLGTRVAIDRATNVVTDLRSSVATNRRTRKQTENLLRRQLERSGL